MNLTSDVLTRFWAKVDRQGPDDCWLWTGSLSQSGYGLQKIDRRHVLAHRLAWQVGRGEIPPGLCVLHDCDARYPPGDIANRRCVNPNHLFLGTQQDNQADKVAKGRQARGDRIWSHLHPEVVARGDQHWTRVKPERIARGSRSGAHTHPERLARGERNGARTRPDRRPRGERNGTAILTAEKVREIREQLAAGVSHKRLSLEYGVSTHNISAIAYRKTWRHVE